MNWEKHTLYMSCEVRLVWKKCRFAANGDSYAFYAIVTVYRIPFATVRLIGQPRMLLRRFWIQSPIFTLEWLLWQLQWYVCNLREHKVRWTVQCKYYLWDSKDGIGLQHTYQCQRLAAGDKRLSKYVHSTYRQNWGHIRCQNCWKGSNRDM